MRSDRVPCRRLVAVGGRRSNDESQIARHCERCTSSAGSHVGEDVGVGACDQPSESFEVRDGDDGFPAALLAGLIPLAKRKVPELQLSYLAILVRHELHAAVRHGVTETANEFSKRA